MDAGNYSAHTPLTHPKSTSLKHLGPLAIPSRTPLVFLKVLRACSPSNVLELARGKSRTGARKLHESLYQRVTSGRLWGFFSCNHYTGCKGSRMTIALHRLQKQNAIISWSLSRSQKGGAPKLQKSALAPVVEINDLQRKKVALEDSPADFLFLVAWIV